MRKKLKLKYLIPGIILILLLSGCNTGDTPVITSSSPTISENEPESSIASTSSIPQSSLSETASAPQSNLGTTTSTPQSSLSKETSSKNQSASKHSNSSNTSSKKPSLSTVSSSSKPSSTINEKVPTDKLEVNPPVPITFVDSVEGEAIDFEEKTIDVNSGNDNWDSHIAVIRSCDELKAIYEGEDFFMGIADYDYTKLYTNSFFDDNVLVTLFVFRGSSAYTYTIDSVTQKNDRLYISMNNKDYPPGSVFIADSAYFRTFITVSKEDMAKITDIVVYQDARSY